MVKYDKDVQRLEAEGGHGEEVHCSRHVHVIPEERQPRRGWLVWALRLDHVPADRVFARNTAPFRS